LVPEVSSMVR